MTTKVLLPLLLLVIIIVAIPVSMNAFYVVREGEQVVVTEFGRPIGNSVSSPGLKFKTPFIQQVHRFEQRILEWDGSPNQIPTKDKKFIWLDTTARWRISDALKFYEALGTEQGAQYRLDDIIDSAARDLVTANMLIEAVRDTNRLLDLDLESLEEENTQSSAEPLEQIVVGREKITEMILANAQAQVPEYGIELVDVRIKRINYVDEVRTKVFSRMISERERIAAKYRSEGEGEAADIMGQKQKELERIQSEAYRAAEQTKGTADAEAIQIYAEAHSQDAEFFSFLQTLETYRKTSNENTRLILTTDSDLYGYLKSAGMAGR